MRTTCSSGVHTWLLLETWLQRRPWNDWFVLWVVWEDLPLPPFPLKLLPAVIFSNLQGSRVLFWSKAWNKGRCSDPDGPGWWLLAWVGVTVDVFSQGKAWPEGCRTWLYTSNSFKCSGSRILPGSQRPWPIGSGQRRRGRRGGGGWICGIFWQVQ